VIAAALAATSLAAAGPALAQVARQPPEFGHCYGTAEGAGYYTDPNCSATTGAFKTWEWFPAVSQEVGFFAGKLSFETVAGTMRCTGIRAVGRYASPKALSDLPLHFTGCARSGEPCTSASAASGEVLTAVLSGQLGTAPEQGPGKSVRGVTALELSPPAADGTFTELSCGATTIVMRGSPVARIYRVAGRQPTIVLYFAAKRGRQALESLDGGAANLLEASEAGGGFRPVPLKGILKDANRDRMVIDLAP
jgi:hypothetical protein